MLLKIANACLKVTVTATHNPLKNREDRDSFRENYTALLVVKRSFRKIEAS